MKLNIHNTYDYEIQNINRTMPTYRLKHGTFTELAQSLIDYYIIVKVLYNIKIKVLR